MEPASIIREDGMAKGYWIGMVEVKDADGHMAYVEAARPAFEAHGARFLARGGAATEMEGALGRIPSCGGGVPELSGGARLLELGQVYQAARTHRETASVVTIVITEGLEG